MGWPLTERHFKGVWNTLWSCLWFILKIVIYCSPAWQKKKQVQSASQSFYKYQRCVFATVDMKGHLFQCFAALCVRGRRAWKVLLRASLKGPGGLSLGGPAVTSGYPAHITFKVMFLSVVVKGKYCIIPFICSQCPLAFWLLITVNLQNEFWMSQLISVPWGILLWLGYTSVGRGTLKSVTCVFFEASQPGLVSA